MSSTHERPKRGRHFYGPGPYIEREVDEGLLETLRAGEYALVLGARGSGKTSLRIRTTRRLVEDGTRVATVDLGAIGAETRADAFCASLVIEAGRSLGLAEEAKTAWRRSKGPPPMRLRACIRAVLLEPSEEPLVLFIDELALVRALGPARDDFFAALRAMSDARGHDEVWRRLSVCLVGAMTRDELISDPGRSSFDLPAREFGPRDFSREQLGAFAETLAPLGVETEALLDALYDWTSGNPALLQWLCGDLLLRELARGREATTVEAVVRETFLQRGPEVDPLLSDTARRLRRDHRDPYRTRVLAAYERVLRGETIDLRGRQLGSEGALIVARLKVAGLVAASAGAKLRVRNRVVERAFDRNWVRRALAGRPVSDALERWEAGGRRAGALLRGEALEAAVEWVEGRPDVSPSERDFVLASERAHSRRVRGLAMIGSALSLSLAVALGLLYWGEELGLTDSSALATQDREDSRESTDGDALALAPELAPEFAPQTPTTQELHVVASARQVVEQASNGDAQRARITSLETELSALELRLAVERAARAELLAPEPTRRAEGLELALTSMSAWQQAGSSIDDVPAPITRGLTANLPSPGDTMLLSAHEGPVQTIVFTADGARFATLSEDEIGLWERNTGRRVAALTAIAGTVEALAISPSGQRVAALSEGGALTVWDVREGATFGPAPLGAPLDAPMPLAPVGALLIDDGGHVTVLRRDGSLDTVDPKSANSSGRLRASALPRDLALDQAVVIDGGLMAEARVGLVRDGSLELWDVASGKTQASVSLPRLAEAKLRGLLATPGAEALLVQLEGSATLSIWEPAAAKLRELNLRPGSEGSEGSEPSQVHVEALALSSDGELLASGGDDQLGRVWSIETGELLITVEAHDDPLTSLAFTPDGAALVIGDRGGQLRVHPLSFGEASLPLRGAALGSPGAATIHYNDAALELRWASGQTSARWPLPRPLAEAAVSVDGSRLALRYVDGEVVFLGGASGPEGEALARVEGRSLDLALSVDGSLLAVASEDRRVSLINGAGQPIATLSGHEAPVDRLALSADATRLVSADRSKVVRVWDPGTAALLGTFSCDRRAEHLAVAGEHFLVVDQRGGAELWSTQTRDRVASFELGAEPITSLALSADGEWIALGRGGPVAASVELRRASSVEPLARFRAVGPIPATRFADGGETLLAVEGRGRLARWPARPRAWLAEACASLGPGSIVPSVCGQQEPEPESELPSAR